MEVVKYSLPDGDLSISYSRTVWTRILDQSVYNEFSSFVGKFVIGLYTANSGYSHDILFSSLKEAFDYIALNFEDFAYKGIRFGEVSTYYSISPLYDDFYGYDRAFSIECISWRLTLSVSPCCQPDFAPIVKTLGGTPLEDQNDNLKSICQLLDVDTADNGLTDCNLMKDYLKRLVSFLGGSPSDEPNDNLKSICQLLGVDTAENDLKDCDLSKDYVKRISKMLGGLNA